MIFFNMNYNQPPIAVLVVFFRPLQSLWVLQEIIIAVSSVTAIISLIFNFIFKD